MDDMKLLLYNEWLGFSLPYCYPEHCILPHSHPGCWMAYSYFQPFYFPSCGPVGGNVDLFSPYRDVLEKVKVHHLPGIMIIIIPW